MLYHFTYIWNLKQQYQNQNKTTNKQKTEFMDIENRLGGD